MILFFIDKFGERLSKTLLMKLLWQSDRFHFLETGMPMSGLIYKSLSIELTNNELMFDEEELSQRQIRILNSVYEEYKDFNAANASEKIHEEGKEWDTVYNKQNKRYEEIPYELILSCEHLEADEKERLLKKYKEYKYDRQYVG